MVDIHCHLLPGIDDGSKSWESTEEMCRIAAADGIRHIVCSPHANDNYKYDRATFEELLCDLRERIGDTLRFSLGCDFHISFENIQAAMADPDKFLIAGTDYLLVEFSDYAISPGIGDALLRFKAMGITPIITHPERNMVMVKRPDQVVRFAQHGCIIQITANSLTGHWGDGARKFCKWLLDHKAVHVIATDAHDTKFRPPVLSAARDYVAEHYDEKLARALVEDNPQAIVSGQMVPYFPEPMSA